MTDSSPARSKRRYAALAVAWSCALALVAVASADCGIDHRSQEFACTTTADCTGGRTCNADGFCVTDTGSGSGSNPGSGSNHVDAGVPDARHDSGLPPDAAVCPAICSSCDFGAHSCEIDCAVGSNRCGSGATGGSTTVTCPPGFSCNIDCSPQGSCRSLSCIGSLGCTINCGAAGSCRTVACGSGPCDVTCAGQNSCRNVACGESCKCDVNCAGVGTCTGSIICSQDICNGFIDGCDSTNDPSCNTCPM